MAIKPQDIVVLAKLIAHRGDKSWSQNSIAFELCLSPSQINSALKRLVVAGLITPYHPPDKPQPIIQACEEFFIHGLKWVFPRKIRRNGSRSSQKLSEILKLKITKPK